MPVPNYGGPPANFGLHPQQAPPSTVPVLQDEQVHGTESLRSVPIQLPQLADVSKPNPALRAGDWMSEVQPLIADVSEGASTWWKKVTDEANKAYTNWLSAGPLDKMAIQPDVTVEPRYARLEARALTMLLGSIPSALKQEAVSARELTCVQIYKLLKQFQPGGLSEKASLLTNLTKVQPAKTPAEAAEQLRKWQRLLGISRAWNSATGSTVVDKRTHRVDQGDAQQDAQAQFRVNTCRMAHMIDVAPTMVTTEGEGAKRLPLLFSMCFPCISYIC
eukprot:s3109_g7.t1